RAPPVAEGAGAARRPERVADRRERDRADDALAVVLEADEHSVERYPADERRGAVDRIDDPAPAARTGVLAEPLPEHAGLRKGGGGLGADQRLGAAVGDRHRARVALGLDREALRAEVLEREPAGALDGANRDVELPVECGHAGRSIITAVDKPGRALVGD